MGSKAVCLHVYATLAVPGLQQTDDYARVVFMMRRPFLDEETVEQRLTARMARQEIFQRRPLPTLSFVIEESVLRRSIGGWPVMQGQLEQILLHGQRRNVEIQVMPDDRTEHCGLGGPFTLIENREGRRMAYVEVQQNSRLYTERAMVRDAEEQYGILRAQALTPRDSMAFVDDDGGGADIRTAQHPYGFEAADLLGADGALSHVKRAESSAPLSHLFAQGRVSADALRFDAEARAELVRRVRKEKPSHPINDDFVPTKVVYAISLKSGKPLTTQNLFTFAQMSMLQAARALRAHGIEVAVADIPTVVDQPVQ